MTDNIKIPSIRFEHLRKDQVDLVKQWLSQEYVAEYWYGPGLQNTLNSIAKFVNGQETLFTLWIAYDGNIPFAFLMTSKVDLDKDLLYAKYCDSGANAITLDLLIGNPSYLGRGLSHIMIQQLLIQEYSSISDVFIDPGIDNAKAIHVYEKAGFQKCEDFIPEWDPTSPCILMQLRWKQHKFPT